MTETMICESCNGKRHQKTREYSVWNVPLKQVVARLVLCDLCAFPLLFTQAKVKA